MASAISGYITQIQNAIYGEQVRSAIINAITRCYNDVNAPTLTREAFTSILSEMASNGSLPDSVMKYLGILTEPTTNKFNLLTTTVGRLNTSTGDVTTTSTSYITTDWIPVSEGDLLFFDNCSDKVFYDSSKQYVSGISVNGVTSYTVPSNGYIRASCNVSYRGSAKINIGERVAYRPGRSTVDYNLRDNVSNLITLSAEEKAALIGLLNQGGINESE